MSRLEPHFEGLTLFGRLSPEPGDTRYPVGETTRLVELPHYASLAQLRALPALARSVSVFSRSLRGVDCVWLLGPNPLAICFAMIAAARGRNVVLGVRQDTSSYFRSRHPGRPLLRLVGQLLEVAWRLLARFFPVVVVGAELRETYRRARAVEELVVSLVEEEDLIAPAETLARSRREPGRVLSVGRLEEEKNPLLLADVIAELNRGGSWQLVVCGEGTMQASLEKRLEELGQAGAARLAGYVPFGAPLFEIYRSSDVLLQNSWTEGLPQVLLEAFAAGLPVVASDVGGIRASVDGAVELVPAGDPIAAARAIERVTGDHRLRERLVESGHRYVSSHTAQAEASRLAGFLRGGRR